MEFKLKDTPDNDTEADNQKIEPEYINPYSNAGYMDLDSTIKEQTGVDLNNAPKYKNYYEEGPVLGRYSTKNIIKNTIKMGCDLSRGGRSNNRYQNPYSIHILLGILILFTIIFLCVVH